MLENWRECKLGDVIDIIGGGTPKTSISEYWNGNIPWLSVADFNAGKKYVSKTEKTITEQGLKNSSTKLLEKNDIIISARGTVGALAMLEKPMTFNQSCYGVRAKENKSTNDYIFYLLRNTINQLLQLSHGGVFDTITKTTFDEIFISLLPLQEQKAIAEILSSLDDKIDLLHRQNHTLESLAQTLFRQWFIEDANPDWRIKFSDAPIQIIDGDRGKNYPKNNDFFTNEYCLFLSAKNVTKNGFDFAESLFITKERDKLLRKGRLSRNDVVLTTRGTVGNVAYYHELIPLENIRINSGMVIIRADETKLSSLYLYIFMKSFLFSESVIEHTSGSAQPQLPIRDLNNLDFILPSRDIYNKFMEEVKSIYFKVFNNQKQIQTLENLRDTLLPKLISGEVRVDAKQIQENQSNL